MLCVPELKDHEEVCEMAKITARGDREKARWRKTEDGAELVLTVAGRLLHKWRAGESFTLHATRQTEEQAAQHAANLGMERA